MPSSALLSATRLTAPFEPLPEEGLLLPLGPLLLPPVGAAGVKMALGSEMHELAAEFAAEADVGARGLTVPFPEKLHASPSRLLAS